MIDFVVCFNRLLKNREKWRVFHVNAVIIPVFCLISLWWSVSVHRFILSTEWTFSETQQEPNTDPGDSLDSSDNLEQQFAKAPRREVGSRVLYAQTQQVGSCQLMVISFRVEQKTLKPPQNIKLFTWKSWLSVSCVSFQPVSLCWLEWNTM